jgi:urea carboxylase
VGVLFGPHGTEDFLTEQDMEMFFDTRWKVHHNSNRLGIRLLGPNPQWARNNGGEAGLHPSNIHDCEYAIGSINFSGDTPIILTNDGPSLGGFVCPVTICEAEMWKVGQFKPNDKIHFKLLNHKQARELKYQQNERLKLIRDRHWESRFDQNQLNNGGILYQQEKTATSPKIIVRMAGDRYLLIEYGPLVLDLDLRFRVHVLMEWFKARDIIGVLELSPGVRSLQISYDNEQISLARLLDIIIIAEQKIGLLDDQILESRVIKLPIALDDPWNKGAIERYQKSVRKEAPYLPCNLEFITRMNGLDSKQQVLDIICQAQYMVLGLGDVYLGAPCAVPLDPRHRLLTSKYNPARTYTPEGSVGIGGAYMCIYGMESPGGYQLVGRTIPVWDQYTQNRNSKDGKPWLLRFFDRIQFYPVSANELVALRRQYSADQLKLEIENRQFRVADYHQFLEDNQGDIETFRNKQQIAFNKEVQHWHDTGMIGGEASIEEENQHHGEPEETLPEGVFALRAASGGCVLSLLAEVGDTLEKNQDVVVFEAMKMEYKVAALQAGKLEAYKVQPGDIVHQGQIIALVKAAS